MGRGRSQRRAWLRHGALVLALALAVFAIVFLLRAQAANSGRVFNRLAAWSEIGAFVLTVAGVAWSLVCFAVRNKDARASTADHNTAGSESPGEDRERLDQATQVLGEAVGRQWADEAAVQGLRRSQPLRVRWSATGRPVAGHPADVLDSDLLRGRTARLRLDGELSEVVAKFRRLPRRQVVVLGEPAAGKSVLAMLLTLGLLDQREPGEPVPVLLSLSSWDPGSEHLHTWMARRLTADYRVDPDTAQRLVTTGRAMPVLDGLDELPAALQPAAIRGLDRATGDRPLVVTCRTGDYEGAVAAGGLVLATAAVVELEPVDLDSAAAFLTAVPSGVTRWQPVLDVLRAHPDAPLAHALASPLMVALARAIYTVPATEPRELLGLADQDAVERRLLDGFIAAAYTHHPPSPDTRPGPDDTRYQPEQARRWLTFLACHLRHLDTPDLAWWQLPPALPKSAPRLAGGMVAGLVTGLVTKGFTFGLMGGLMVGLVAGLVGAPRNPQPTRQKIMPGLVGGLLAGAVCLLYKDHLLGFVYGFAAGFAVGYVGAPGTVQPKSPQPYHQKIIPGLVGGLVAGGRGAGIVAWSIAGLVAGLSAGILAGPLVGLAMGLGTALVVWVVFGLVFGLSVPVDITQAVSPVSMVRSDRTVALATGLVFGLALGLVFGLGVALLSGIDLYPDHARAGFVAALSLGLRDGIAAGTGVAIVGLVLIADSAYGQFNQTRMWLALQGRLPWRTMAFLEHAHRRGVLRRVGAVYQFRHARLQDVLASGPVPDVLTRPGGLASTRDRRALIGTGIARGIMLVSFLVAILVPVAASRFSGTDGTPPLARICPPTSARPSPRANTASPLPGPRVVDTDSGISYRKHSGPLLHVMPAGGRCRFDY